MGRTLLALYGKQCTVRGVILKCCFDSSKESSECTTPRDQSVYIFMYSLNLFLNFFQY